MKTEHHLAAGAAMHRTIVFGDPLVLRPQRLTHRLLARAFRASLDLRLAAGCLPEASPLLATRAQEIVSMRRRRALAANWDHLLRVARRARWNRPIPLCTAHIVAAESGIREVMRRLCIPLPITAQGGALASVLLSDPTGPVYSRHCPVTLPPQPSRPR